MEGEYDLKSMTPSAACDILQIEFSDFIVFYRLQASNLFAAPRQHNIVEAGLCVEARIILQHSNI